MTLRQLLQELSFIQINNIKRNAKGLLLGLEKSNRKEFLDYEIKENYIVLSTKNYIVYQNGSVIIKKQKKDNPLLSL